MKKKILALTLAAMMIVSLFALTSCAKETPFSLVTGAVAKTNALDAIDIDMDMDIEMTIMDETMNVPMEIDMQATGLRTDDMKSYMEMTMEMSGIEVATEVYQEGDYFYMSMLGMDMKMKAGEFTADYDGMSDVESMVKTLPEEIFTEDVVIVENDDGTKTVALTIPDEKFGEIYTDLVDEMAASVAEGTTIADLVLTNTKVEITVDENGYISVYGITFDMALTMDMGADMAALGMGTIKATATVDTVIRYNNPGEPVTVTPMEGYESFTEVSESDFLM